MEFRNVLQRSNARTLEDPVDPMFEASNICKEDRTTAWIAPAKGFRQFRLAGNVYPTRERVAHILKTSAEGVSDLLVNAMERPIPPRRVDTPRHFRDIDASALPIPTYFKGDGGPYITSGIFHAGYGGVRNLSFHRMMWLGRDRFAVRVVPRHLMALLRTAKEKGEHLKAVVSIGADLPSLLAGSTTMAYGQDEMEMASSLSQLTYGAPLDVFSPEGNDLLSPVGSEIVMIGEFLDETAPEGPFVDITSTRDDSGLEPGEPVFQVKKVLCRNNAIMHVLLPGGYEHFLLMGLPKEPSILQSVGKVVPKVHAVRLTEGGCCWLHGAVSITKQKEGDGKNAIMAAFTGHPSMKKVTVVDGDIDIFDDRELEWAVATRFQAHRDMVMLEGARGSTLDPSMDPDGTTSKVGIDATMPLHDTSRFKKVRS